MGRAPEGRGTLTARAMASALGISKSEAHRDSQRGMPMHSVEAARQWRAETHDVSRSAQGRIDRPQQYSVQGSGAGAEVTSKVSAPAARHAQQDSLPAGVWAALGASPPVSPPQQFCPAPPAEGGGHSQHQVVTASGDSPLMGGADDDRPLPGDTSEYREARAGREKIRREREQLELDELKGKLIGVEDASRAAFTAFRGLRDAVLNVPARIKDELAGETDPFRVEHLLEDELTSALAGFKVAAAVRDEQDDDEED